MRWEIAYAIQRRVDERRTKTRPESILRLIRALPGGGVTSLLDRTPEDWTAFLGYSSDRGYIERRFLLDAISYLHDLVDGVGWEEEYPRDVWLLRRLGYPSRDGQLRFDGIEASLAACLDETLDPLAAFDRHHRRGGARGRPCDHPVRAVLPVAAARPAGRDPRGDRSPSRAFGDPISGAEDADQLYQRRRRAAADCPTARLGAWLGCPRRSLPG